MDRVLDRGAGPLLTDGDVALVAHGHVLRVLTARWLGLPPEGGALFALAAGSFGVLGHEHERQAVLEHRLRWPRRTPLTGCQRLSASSTGGSGRTGRPNSQP